MVQRFGHRLHRATNSSRRRGITNLRTEVALRGPETQQDGKRPLTACSGQKQSGSAGAPSLISDARGEVPSVQRLALSCVDPKERSDRGPRQLQCPSWTALSAAASSRACACNVPLR